LRSNEPSPSPPSPVGLTPPALIWCSSCRCGFCTPFLQISPLATAPCPPLTDFFLPQEYLPSTILFGKPSLKPHQVSPPPRSDFNQAIQFPRIFPHKQLSPKASRATSPTVSSKKSTLIHPFPPFEAAPFHRTRPVKFSPLFFSHADMHLCCCFLPCDVNH